MRSHLMEPADAGHEGGLRTGGTGLIGSVPLVLSVKAKRTPGPEGADAGCPGDRRRGHRPAFAAGATRCRGAAARSSSRG